MHTDEKYLSQGEKLDDSFSVWMKDARAIRHDGQVPDDRGDDKSIIVFSGDLDKALAAFIIANGAAAMGRKVTMFFTFWGSTYCAAAKVSTKIVY